MDVFPMARTCPLDPPAEYADHHPVAEVACPGGINAKIISRYDDVRAVLRDPRFSARGGPSAHAMPNAD